MTRKLQVCTHLRVGPGVSCGGRDSAALLPQLEAALQKAGAGIEVETVQCFVRCARGPNLRLLPEGRFWHGVTADRLAEIVAEVCQS